MNESKKPEVTPPVDKGPKKLAILSIEKLEKRINTLVNFVTQ
jgi:hypothetical protein